jgi:hypothetical protein
MPQHMPPQQQRLQQQQLQPQLLLPRAGIHADALSGLPQQRSLL